MQIDDNPAKGKRVRLTQNELGELYDVLDTSIEDIAVKLMAQAGLRTKEVLDVKPKHVLRADTDGEQWKLRVPEGKGEDGGKWRETMIPTRLADRIQLYAEMRPEGEDTPLVPRNRRTVQRWVEDATEALVDATDDDGWQYVSCHDLRRSWAQNLVDSSVSAIAIMEMGGWEDYETFRDHYLGNMSDESLAAEMAKAY